MIFYLVLLAEEIVYHKCAVENGSSCESNSAVTYTQNDMALIDAKIEFSSNLFCLMVATNGRL